MVGADSDGTALADQLNLGLRDPGGRERSDFVVSPQNAQGVARLDAWSGGILVLVGAEGVGKSHLAHAWAKRAGAHEISRQVALAELVRLPACALLEDADRDVPDEILFHLINMAERPRAALLLTARSRPSAWRVSLPDLRSRLNAAAVIELYEPDETALTQLLARFFRERSISPSSELLAYLVRRIERSAAGARKVVARLDEAAHVQGRPVSRRLARAVLDGADTDASVPGG